MAIPQLPTTDSAGYAHLWNLIDSLNVAANGAIEPTTSNGWAFGIKALIVFLALLVLAVFGLCGAIVFIFLGWRKQQNEGIRALSSNKDKTKQEITDLLKSELGRARDANASDNAEIQTIVTKHGDIIHLILLDLVILGQKSKIGLRSSPTHITPPKEGG